MTVSQNFLIAALGISGSLLATLIAVIWWQLNRGIAEKFGRASEEFEKVFERLRTLGHEDRAIRAQLHNTMEIITQHMSDEAKKMFEEKALLAAENEKLRWMNEQATKK